MLALLRHPSARRPPVSRLFVADASSRYDPTGTGGIRGRYAREMERRFRAFRALVRRAVLEQDVLALKSSSVASMMFQRVYGAQGGGVIADAVPLPAARAYEFRSQGDKVGSFMDWLYEAQRDTILQVQAGTPLASASKQSWQNVYIDTAYQKGIRDAGAKLKKGGVNMSGDFVSGAFNRPVHADRVGIIYTRAFRDLEGITDEMDKQMSRVLAQGIAEGRGPQDIARDLVNRVDSIGIVRARTLARTEVINAHAEATLNSYEEAGVEGVRVLAEFSTSKDDAVCELCEDLEGEEYTIEEARGLIPVHPNCRCAYLPVVQ